jgi:hypothetical protein
VPLYRLKDLINHICATKQANTQQSMIIVAKICKNKGVPVPPAINIPANIAYTAINEFIDMQISANDREGLKTRHYSKDKNYPYDDETIRSMGSGADGPGTQTGVPQYKEDSDDDVDKIHKQELESATNHQGMEKLTSKDRYERTRMWAQGERFYDEKEKDNSINKFAQSQKEHKQGNNYNIMNKSKAKKLVENMLTQELKKYVVESIKQNILEKAPPGETKSGKPYSKVVKAIKKSGSNANPYAVAWGMKNEGCAPKSKKEVKENAEEYLKEMGYEKCVSKDKADIWRKKKINKESRFYRNKKKIQEGNMLQTFKDAWNVAKSFKDAYFPKSENDVTPEMKAAVEGSINKNKNKASSEKTLEPPTGMDEETKKKYKKAEPWIRLACLMITSQLPSVSVDDVKEFANKLILEGKVDLDAGKDIIYQIVVTSIKVLIDPMGAAKDEAMKELGETGKAIVDAAMKKGLKAEFKKDRKEGNVPEKEAQLVKSERI